MQRSSAERAAARAVALDRDDLAHRRPITTRSIPARSRRASTRPKPARGRARRPPRPGPRRSRARRPSAGGPAPPGARAREQLADRRRGRRRRRSRAARGSYLVISGASELRSPVAHVGEVGDDEVERAGRRGDRHRSVPEVDPLGEARARAAFSVASRHRVGRGVDRDDGTTPAARRRSPGRPRPLPVPTSSTGPGPSSSATSTSSSVSGRGISTRRVGAQLEVAEAAAAEDVGDGLAGDPAADHRPEGPRLGAARRRRRGRRRGARAVPARRLGEQQLRVEARASRRRPPAARRPPPRSPRRRCRRHRSRRAAHPAPAACASSLRRFSSAPSASLNSRRSPAEDLVEGVAGQLDPVVGDPALREVVGADLLGALAGPDLRAALGRDLRLLVGDRLLEQARAQHPHRLVAVLQLRLLVLHRDHDPARLVGDPDRRVGRVDRLPARPRGAVDVDLQVVGVDGDVDLLGLREHGDGRGRGVDPPLRLGLRHPLDAVGAALVLEHRVGAVALDRERDLLEAADLGRALGEDLGAEAALLGVAGEHLVEVAREQRRLVAPGAGADLDEDVLVVVGVALDHRQADRLGELLEPGRSLGDDPAQLLVLVVGEQLAGPLEVVVERPPLAGQPRWRPRARCTRARPRRSAPDRRSRRGPTSRARGRRSGSSIWLTSCSIMSPAPSLTAPRPGAARRDGDARPAGSCGRSRSVSWISCSSARRIAWQSVSASTRTWAESAGKPEVTSQTCRSWTSTTPGDRRPSRCRSRPGSRPRGAASRKTRPDSRSRP